jgi:nicotinamidase-related amidase
MAGPATAAKECIMQVDPRTTAVVLVEYQNDFTTEGGTLHGAVEGVMKQNDMLENSQRVVDAARRAGATILHAPITFAPGYGELGDPDKVYGILKGVIDSNSFVKGTWGAEICDQMAPQEGDIIVEGKRGLDTFATTNIDFILRSRGIETVALSGFLTNCCVESTMRTAYEKGYDVITLTDCTAATSDEEQQSAVTKDYPMFSKPMTGSEFTEVLQAAAVAGD